MTRILASIAFTLAAASGAFAQDGLTPTDVLEGGQFTASARLNFAKGQGNIAPNGGSDLDVDLTQFEVVLQGAVGLSSGLEVEVSIPYQFTGDTNIDGTNFEQDFEEIGFGDLLVNPNYAIMRDGQDSVQLILGALIIAPTGKKEPAEPETQIGPLSFPGEEGGIGDGIWRFGGIVGISRRMGVAEPYFTIAYLSGDEVDLNNNKTEVERPDIWNLTLGSEFHFNEKVTLDVRGTLQLLGDETEEDKASGVQTVEEGHFAHTWQATLYFTAGSGVTLLAGAAVSFLEDHEIDDTTQADLEDTFIFGATIGIHINLGK